MRRLASDPHLALLAGVGFVAGCEYGREQARGVSWALVEVAVGAVVLALVWRSRERLRLPQLLVVALAASVAWLLARAHASLGVDFEWRDVYARQGRFVLDGRYPRSEYPTGAVSLFALEAWLHGGRSHLVHSSLMLPFQLLAVGAIWSLRTRWSAWLAAVVAFWPLDAWFLEYRFDIVPTGLLAAGLAFAWRRHWLLAGAALGLGSAVKWSPALAALPLLAYLLSARRAREAARLAIGVAGSLLVVYVPYLVWSPGNVVAAYSKQGGRSITDESLWHLPLHWLGLEGRHNVAYPLFGSVRPPGWADAAAIAVQVVALVCVVWLGARAASPPVALALGALAPVVFLLTNRVFSVQYFVVLVAAWAIAVAVLAVRDRDALAMTVLALASTAFNVLIVPYPIHRPYAWEAASAARFALALALTGWLVARAARREPWPALLSAPAGATLRP